MFQSVFQSVRKSDCGRRSLGIDIGEHAIKAILLQETADGHAVRHAARVPIPAGAIVDGVVVDRREVAARIREATRMSGARPATASLSVPTEQVVVRWIDLPRLDPDSLRAATRFEARKYLPYPVDRAEAEILPMAQTGDEEAGHMRALLAAAPREVVRSRADALEAAGLEVACVELECFALLRALNPISSQRGMLWRGQPVAYVLLGSESSGMCVVQDSNLRFVRAISWGSDRLTAALAEALDCSVEEARAIREDPASSVALDGSFSWTMGEARLETSMLMAELDRLRREIQRLLNYYRSLFPERSYEGILDRVVLCGGAADLDGLNRYFANALHVDVTKRNPFHSFASRLSPDSFGAIKGHESSFVVAIGLALGELQMGARSERSRSLRSREFIWRRKAA